MMYNVCDRHPLVCVSRLMVALQLYIIQQRVSLVCAKFRICSFIDQNITLEELAEYAHLSEGQFCRSFKELTGMTPFRYLIRYRILQSCNQLLLTDKKVTEIALSCGFNNISYYNRAFFKIMRMTPTEYRKTTEKNSTFII